MRILVVCKRRYTGKDLLDHRYGRLYEIPAALASMGHDVRGLALSYRRTGEVHERRETPCLRWSSVNALPFGLVRYEAAVARVTADWTPDVLWASSDVLHCVLAERYSRHRGIPLVVDLYDNYESFGMARLPGITRLFRRACGRAGGVSVVSETLAAFVSSAYDLRQPVRVIVNGVDERRFRPLDRAESREKLGLPAHARLIGTAGSITDDRGIADMFEAFQQLAREDDRLYLVYAGPRDDTPSRYRHPRIVDLGVLPSPDVPALLSALDVAIICNRDSAFGRYCFPQKLHECIACATPVVAAATGDVASVLAGVPGSLYTPGDSSELARGVARRLKDRRVHTADVPSWQDCATQLDGLLREIVAAARLRRLTVDR